MIFSSLRLTLYPFLWRLFRLVSERVRHQNKTKTAARLFYDEGGKKPCKSRFFVIASTFWQTVPKVWHLWFSFNFFYYIVWFRSFFFSLSLNTPCKNLSPRSFSNQVSVSALGFKPSSICGRSFPSSASSDSNIPHAVIMAHNCFLIGSMDWCVCVCVSHTPFPCLSICSGVCFFI